MNSLKSLRWELWHGIRKHSRLISSTTILPTKIVIPSKIERSPTDILKALDSTVKRDSTGPAYKFQDDPFLTPAEHNHQYFFALSRESGRNTAIWVQDQHADLFNHRVAQPEVSAFLPTPVYKDKSQVSEEILLNVISQADISEAVHIYELLEGEVTTKTKQSLLELLCFYNVEDPCFEDQLERNWLIRNKTKSKIFNRKSKKKFQEMAVINKLFSFLIKQDEHTKAAAYNALICGKAKSLNEEEAWKLYEECIEKNYPLSIHAYNAILGMFPSWFGNKKDSKVNIREKIMEIFKSMTNNQVSPNIHTFNNALCTLTMLNDNYIANRSFAVNILSKLKECNLTPSLTTYKCILSLFKRGKNFEQMFNQVIDRLQAQPHTFQDPNDSSFFLDMMRLVQKMMLLSIGKRLHETYLLGNYDKFVCSYKDELDYYYNYVKLLLELGTFDDFRTFYEKEVPHIYLPKANARQIINVLSRQPAPVVQEFIVKFWSDVLIWNIYDNSELTCEAFRLMQSHSSPECISTYNTQIADLTWDTWTQLQHLRATKSFVWKGELLGNMAIILLRASRFDDMVQIIKFLYTKKDTLIDERLTQEQISCLLEGCIKEKDKSTALILLECAVNSEIEGINAICEYIKQSLPLTSFEEKQVNKFILEDAQTTT